MEEPKRLAFLAKIASKKHVRHDAQFIALKLVKKLIVNQRFSLQTRLTQHVKDELLSWFDRNTLSDSRVKLLGNVRTHRLYSSYLILAFLPSGNKGLVVCDTAM